MNEIDYYVFDRINLEIGLNLILIRTMPGPTVVACVGDHVVVDVRNKLHSMTTSLHFHGK